MNLQSAILSAAYRKREEFGFLGSHLHDPAAARDESLAAWAYRT